MSSQKFFFYNRNETALRLILEPWAEEYTVQPGQRVDIIVTTASVDDFVEFEHHPEAFLIWGQHDRSYITLSTNGKELVPTAQG